MDESTWLASAVPQAMIPCLLQRGGTSSHRKLRLFACACVRRVWHLVGDERSRRTVEIAERYADGQASREDLKTARAAAHVAASAGPGATAAAWAAHAAWCASRQRGTVAGRTAAAAVEVAVIAESAQAVRAATPPSFLGWLLGRDARRAEAAGGTARADEKAAQADLLREIAGPLLFRPLPLDLAWLARDGGAVRRLARALYAEGRWEDLPVLADALDDAGCDIPELLGHLRSGQGHVLGCWALDLVLRPGQRRERQTPG